MSEAHKILGQAAPASEVTVDVYTVPAGKSAVVSSIVICNRAISGIAESFRVSVAVAGEAESDKQFLLYGETLMPQETMIATVGVTLAATDVVRVYADGSAFSFNLFGVEITP